VNVMRLQVFTVDEVLQARNHRSDERRAHFLKSLDIFRGLNSSSWLSRETSICKTIIIADVTSSSKLQSTNLTFTVIDRQLQTDRQTNINTDNQ